MTVCVAAMADGQWILAAADRMITTGDIEYEPPRSKIVNVSNAISILWAGDAAAQAEILPAVLREAGDRIEKNKDEWWLVSDVARLYQKHYFSLWRRHAEVRVLAPLNLDSGQLVRAVKDMADTRWKYLVEEISKVEPLGVQAIIFGLDPSGTHIFVANDERVECHDSVAFAAIGAGYRHAESFLMFAKHTSSRSTPETLFDVYSAKKFAEAAPFVGEQTDLWFMGPPLGSRKVGENTINDTVIKELEVAYEESRKNQAESASKASTKFQKALDSMVQKAATSTDQSADSKNQATSA
jgi:20S proteasome alpha/beta subunit